MKFDVGQYSFLSEILEVCCSHRGKVLVATFGHRAEGCVSRVKALALIGTWWRLPDAIVLRNVARPIDTDLTGILVVFRNG